MSFVYFQGRTEPPKRKTKSEKENTIYLRNRANTFPKRKLFGGRSEKLASRFNLSPWKPNPVSCPICLLVASVSSLSPPSTSTSPSPSFLPSNSPSARPSPQDYPATGLPLLLFSVSSLFCVLYLVLFSYSSDSFLGILSFLFLTNPRPFPTPPLHSR